MTWVGGSSGNWFNPANWTGGAVPDLANVANVVIPSGVTVSFAAAGAVAPANALAPVQITGLSGSGSSLAQSDGTLNVGSGGITLAQLSQSGGSISLGGNLVMSQGFSQGSSGSLNVGGNAQINSSGTTNLGTITVSGNLNIGSVGDITQTGPLSVTGASSLDSTAGNVTLANAGNALNGTVSASGNNVSVTNAAGLQLGTVTAANNLTLNTGGGGLNGGLSQVGALSVGGSATFTANTSLLQDALLTHAANQFNGPVVFNTQSGGSWNNLSLTHASTQDPLQMVLPATANNVTLDTRHGGLQLVTQLPTVLTGNLSTTSGGSTSLGMVTVGGNLNVSSVGDVTQTGVLHVTGSSEVNASAGQVNLNNPGNIFVGTSNIDNGSRTPVVLVPAAATNAVMPGASAVSAAGSTSNAVPVAASSANLATSVDMVSPAPSVASSVVASPALPTLSAPSAPVAAAAVVTNVRTASPTQVGVVTVSLPVGTTANAAGWVIQLPDEVNSLIANPGWALTTAGNASLPSWLKYDPGSKSLIVGSGAPKNAFPLQVVGSAGGMKVVIQIDEGQPKP